MGNVGGGEILVILLVALIFLGPEKLPEVARQMGKVVGEIRKVTPETFPGASITVVLGSDYPVPTAAP